MPIASIPLHQFPDIEVVHAVAGHPKFRQQVREIIWDEACFSSTRSRSEPQWYAMTEHGRTIPWIEVGLDRAALLLCQRVQKEPSIRVAENSEAEIILTMSR